MGLPAEDENALRAVFDDALHRSISPDMLGYVTQSAHAIKDGLRGGEPWALDIIKMLLMAVAVSRRL